MAGERDADIQALGEALPPLARDEEEPSGGGGEGRPASASAAAAASAAVPGWSKEVQHLQLQESGYQNKYIWVQQQYCSECKA